MLRECFNCNKRPEIFVTYFYNILCYVGCDHSSTLAVLALFRSFFLGSKSELAKQKTNMVSPSLRLPGKSGNMQVSQF